MKIKPLGTRIVVRWDEAHEGKTRGGIILPADEHKGRVIRGELMAKGKDCTLAAEIGDTIIIGKYAGAIVNEGDVRYLICNEVDAKAVES